MSFLFMMHCISLYIILSCNQGVKIIEVDIPECIFWIRSVEFTLAKGNSVGLVVNTHSGHIKFNNRKPIFKREGWNMLSTTIF